jgi:hypothetical protein
MGNPAEKTNRCPAPGESIKAGEKREWNLGGTTRTEMGLRIRNDVRKVSFDCRNEACVTCSNRGTRSCGQLRGICLTH